jgi:hypothetical protein
MRCAEALGVAVADLMSETTGERPPLLIIMFLIASINNFRLTRELGKKIVTKCQGIYIPNLCKSIKLNADELNS